MKRAAAWLSDLEADGYLVKVEEYAHNVGTCYRCKTTVEPMTFDPVVRENAAVCRSRGRGG